MYRIRFVLAVFCSLCFINVNAQSPLHQFYRLENGVYSPRFGERTSQGDVNGDGVTDLVTSTYGYPGKVLIYFGGKTFDTDVDVTLEGTSYKFGYNMEASGDYNGDGFCDVLVSAFTGDEDEPDSIYVYFGGATMSCAPDIIIPALDTNSKGSIEIVNLDDVNGDGFDDFAVTGPGYNNETGRLHIYLGGDSLKSVPSVTYSSGAGDYYFGRSVYNLGDINGDGYADFGFTHGYYESRMLYLKVCFGGADVSAPEFVTIQAPNWGDSIFSVTKGADFNADGFKDFIVVYQIGPFWQDYQVNFFLGASDFEPVPFKEHFFDGSENTQLIKAAVTHDVNGDGFGDWMICKKGPFLTRTYFIYTGSASMEDTLWGSILYDNVTFPDDTEFIGVDDMDNDGFSEIIVGTQDGDQYGIDAYAYTGLIAEFTVSDTLAAAPCQIQFSDQSKGQVETRIWDFGDGTQSTDVDPLHTYQQPGDYTVSLIVSNAFGSDTSIVEKAVTVMPSSGVAENSLGNGESKIVITSYPNPFVSQTKITVKLPEPGAASVGVYDVRGRRVRTLQNNQPQSRLLELIWDGRDDTGNRLPSGIYFCRVTTASGAKAKRIVLIN